MATITTKALTLGRSGPIALKEFPVEALKPTEILIKTKAIALNPVDVKLGFLAYIKELHPGKDYSGVVEQVGSNVKNFKVGDEVCGMTHSVFARIGSYAVVDVDVESVLHKPQQLSFEEAAAFPLTLGTAITMIRRANINTESRVLVLGGASMVGTFLVQLLHRYYKVKYIVATCSGSSAEYVRSHGADVIIDYKTADVRGALKCEAAEEKFNAIFDAVGGYDALAVRNEILEPMSKGSAYVTIIGDSAPSGSYSRSFIGTAMGAPRVIARLLLGKYMGINYHLIVVGRDDWEKIALEAIQDPSFKIPIDTVYPISEYKAAWDKLNSAKAHGKVVLTF